MNRRPNTAVRQRNCGVLGVDPRTGGQGVVLGGEPALDERHHESARRADERLARPDQGLTDRLDGPPVGLDRAEEVVEVVLEGQVDHAVGGGGRLAQAVEVVEVAAVHLGAHGRQGRGPVVRAGQADDLMSGLQQLGHDGRPDVARRAGDENSHDELPEMTFEAVTPPCVAASDASKTCFA